MNEQSPQDNNQEYLETHPDAVQDPAKAEIMAYASKGAEEAVIEHREKALDAASNIGNPSYRLLDRGAEDAAKTHTDLAIKSRENADLQADKAGEVYDTVKPL